jgi:hypothetical protein
MIHGVYIVNHGGETQASINLGEFSVDEVLFGGFLSAIQMYTQQMSGEALQEISLDKYRMVISKTDHVFVVTVHDREDKDVGTLNKKVMDLLKDGMDEVITEDTVELIRKATAKIAGASDRATEWASKML